MLMEKTELGFLSMQVCVSDASPPRAINEMRSCVNQLVVVDKNNFEEESLFGAHVSEVQFMAGWLHCSGYEVSQNVVLEGHGGRRLLSSWQPGSRE